MDDNEEKPPTTPKFERPVLTHAGNLQDLLGGGGSKCDSDGETGQGGPPGQC